MAQTMEEALRASGMTRYRLSKVSGIPWATLSDICSGKTDLERCSAGTVRKLSRALGMTMEEVMDLETGEITVLSCSCSDPDDIPLPDDLKQAIEELEAGFARNDPNVDLYIDAVYGAINANQWSERITKSQADRLRAKYYYGETDDRLHRVPPSRVQRVRGSQRHEDRDRV